MDTNKIQTNSFSKGMNTDTSDALLGSDQYRMARNLRLVTNTGENDNELHMIEGVSKVAEYFSEVYAVTKIRNYGIIIGKKIGNTGWSIFRFDNNTLTYSDDNPFEGFEVVFGPSSEDIGLVYTTATRWISDDNVKLYFTCEKKGLMSCNILNKYENFSDILSEKQIHIPALTAAIKTNSFGSVPSGVIQYAQVAYENAGSTSKVSPLSKPVSVYTDDQTGYKAGETSNKSVLVSNIYKNEKLYTRIYRITYVESGQDPVINLIYDRKNADTEYIDNGINISTLSVAEFISITGIQFKPVLIESKDNYLFAANIQYEQSDVDDLFKDVTVSIEDTQSDEYVMNNGTVESGTYGPSFREGEYYRFGVVFYTKDGRRSSVLKVTDVQCKSETYIELPSNSSGIGNPYNNCRAAFKQNGFKFTLSNLPVECAGYEIVRCRRTINDTITLSQGIVGHPFYTEASSSIEINGDVITSPFMSLQHILMTNRDNGTDRFKTMNTVRGNVRTSRNGPDVTGGPSCLLFASPESSYIEDFYRSFKQNKPNLKIYLGSTYASEFSGRIWSGMEDLLINNLDSDDDLYLYRLGFGELDYQTVDYGDYIYPTSKLSHSPLFISDIQDLEFVESPEYNKFDDGNNIIIDDSKIVVGNISYVNWFAPYLYRTGKFSDSRDDTDEAFLDRHDHAASGKQCFVMEVDGTSEIFKTIPESKLPITVANLIQKNVTKDTVYGGLSDAAKANSIFYSFGDYTSAKKSSIEVFSGDSYNGQFIYNSSHTFDSSKYNHTTYCACYIVPIVSSIDYLSTYGSLGPRSDDYDVRYQQDVPVSYKGYSQKHSAYLYNPAYSEVPSAVTFANLDRTKETVEKFDNRILYSQQADNDDLDSWLIFKSANFLDVDSRYGKITNLKLFNNTLIFWQEHATGMLSVNERSVVQDANDTNIVLGTGDVLQRYDYLTTLYGMHEGQYSDTQSATTLYWWDDDNKHILGYSGGQQVVYMNKYKLVSNYINSSDRIAKPALAYDLKYKEVLFNVVDDGYNAPLVYNEDIQQFTGVYETPFDHSISFADRILFFKGGIICARENDVEQSELSNGIKIGEKPFLSTILPYLKYVVNSNSTITKVYDTMEFYGELDKNKLNFSFYTPLKQETHIFDGSKQITDREYNYQAVIPRAGKWKASEEDEETQVFEYPTYGLRMRGKTMQCEMLSNSGSTDFSLQYIITKFRISWS